MLAWAAVALAVATGALAARRSMRLRRGTLHTNLLHASQEGVQEACK